MQWLLAVVQWMCLLVVTRTVVSCLVRPFTAWNYLYYLYYLLPTTYYLLPTTYYLLPTTYYLIPNTYYLLPTTYYLLPTTYYLLPTLCPRGRSAYTRTRTVFVRYLLPTTYYLLPTTYYLLPTTYYLLPTTYYLLPTTYYLLPTSYLLPTTYYLLPTTYYLLPTTYYLLPTTYYLLPTTYYLLPTTYYLLPTTYYLLRTKQHLSFLRQSTRTRTRTCTVGIRYRTLEWQGGNKAGRFCSAGFKTSVVNPIGSGGPKAMYQIKEALPYSIHKRIHVRPQRNLIQGIHANTIQSTVLKEAAIRNSGKDSTALLHPDGASMQLTAMPSARPRVESWHEAGDSASQSYLEYSYLYCRDTVPYPRAGRL